jgi:hypothetical protein
MTTDHNVSTEQVVADQRTISIAEASPIVQGPARDAEQPVDSSSTKCSPGVRAMASPPGRVH